MKAHDFLLAFPHTEREHHTGGGCMAWRLVLADGTYLLLTDDGGGYPPGMGDRQVTVGHYDQDGEPMTGDCDICTWDEAITLAREQTDVAIEAAAAAQGFGLMAEEPVSEDMGPVGKSLEQLVDMHGTYDVLADLAIVLRRKGNATAADALEKLAEAVGE